MKTSLLVLFFGLNVLSVIAKPQAKGKLIYKIFKDDVRFGKREFESVIYIGNNASIEFPIQKTLKEMNLNADENHDYVIIKNIKSPFIYKNFTRKCLFFNGQVGLHRSLLTNDTLLNFNWKITKEKAEILNYNCIKATTYFRGRKYCMVYRGYSDFEWPLEILWTTRINSNRF